MRSRDEDQRSEAAAVQRLKNLAAGDVKEGEQEMANQLGKVYICGKCGSQVIVTKGGNGALKCCGAEMEQKK